MNILIDREILVQMRELLSIANHPAIIEIVIANIDAVLRNNPEPKKGKCVICGEETDDRTSALTINYCPRCWNSGRRLDEDI
jgi:hypothetical protein